MTYGRKQCVLHVILMSLKVWHAPPVRGPHNLYFLKAAPLWSYTFVRAIPAHCNLQNGHYLSLTHVHVGKLWIVPMSNLRFYTPRLPGVPRLTPGIDEQTEWANSEISGEQTICPCFAQSRALAPGASCQRNYLLDGGGRFAPLPSSQLSRWTVGMLSL